MTTKQALDAEWMRLDAAVDAAVKERTAWEAAHLMEYSDFKVGDGVFNGYTCTKIGVVKALLWEPGVPRVCVVYETIGGKIGFGEGKMIDAPKRLVTSEFARRVLASMLEQMGVGEP